MANVPAPASNGTEDNDADKVPVARPGDILQARGIHGESPRRGEILEVLGESGHERYRVRWEDRHESIVFPADGVSITRPAPRSHRPTAKAARRDQ